jgi:hypothetical protein
VRPGCSAICQEFYQLRKYALQTGPQLALAQNYFEHALIPALNRMAMARSGLSSWISVRSADILFVNSGHLSGSPISGSLKIPSS